MEHCEQPLPEGVHPEEFVAIADYSAADETQVVLCASGPCCVDSSVPGIR